MKEKQILCVDIVHIEITIIAIIYRYKKVQNFSFNLMVSTENTEPFGSYH